MPVYLALMFSSDWDWESSMLEILSVHCCGFPPLKGHFFLVLLVYSDMSNRQCIIHTLCVCVPVCVIRSQPFHNELLRSTLMGCLLLEYSLNSRGWHWKTHNTHRNTHQRTTGEVFLKWFLEIFLIQPEKYEYVEIRSLKLVVNLGGDLYPIYLPYISKSTISSPFASRAIWFRLWQGKGNAWLKKIPFVCAVLSFVLSLTMLQL